LRLAGSGSLHDGSLARPLSCDTSPCDTGFQPVPNTSHVNGCFVLYIASTGWKPTGLHLLLDHRPQDDVTVVRAAVVALQVDRAGAERVGPERAAGAPFDGLVVDDLLAVEDHGDVAIDERDV